MTLRQLVSRSPSCIKDVLAGEGVIRHGDIVPPLVILAGLRLLVKSLPSHHHVSPRIQPRSLHFLYFALQLLVFSRQCLLLSVHCVCQLYCVVNLIHREVLLLCILRFLSVLLLQKFKLFLESRNLS